MKKFKGNIIKFKNIKQEEGLAAALSHSFLFIIAKTGLFHNHKIIGKFVELTGNKVKISGCTFDVDNPLISTLIKSRFIIGYEKSERRAVRRLLNKNLPVIELGGSIGVVACVTNKKLTDKEAHVVVEANPDLIPTLKNNRDLNKCSFQIINKAYGYSTKDVKFYINKIFSSGGTKKTTEESMVVPTITLDEIFKNYQFKHANLICDIEGGELEMIENEIDLISKKVFQIIIEIHPNTIGQAATDKIIEQLKSAHFRKIRTGIYGNVLVFQNTTLEQFYKSNNN